jgi:hypothetical protein
VLTRRGSSQQSASWKINYDCTVISGPLPRAHALRQVLPQGSMAKIKSSTPPGWRREPCRPKRKLQLQLKVEAG